MPRSSHSSIGRIEIQTTQSAAVPQCSPPFYPPGLPSPRRCSTGITDQVCIQQAGGRVADRERYSDVRWPAKLRAGDRLVLRRPTLSGFRPPGLITASQALAPWPQASAAAEQAFFDAAQSQPAQTAKYLGMRPTIPRRWYAGWSPCARLPPRRT